MGKFISDNAMWIVGVLLLIIAVLGVIVIVMDKKDKKEISEYKAKENNPEKATETVAVKEGTDEVAKMPAKKSVVASKKTKVEKTEVKPAVAEAKSANEEKAHSISSVPS